MRIKNRVGFIKKANPTVLSADALPSASVPMATSSIRSRIPAPFAREAAAAGDAFAPEVAEPDLAYDVGQYTLIAQVAHGGMGTVSLAVSRGAAGGSKLVAIKQLKPEYACDDNYRAMFLEEASLVARLSHPNVVPVREVGSTLDGDPYIVMDYLEGRPLYDILRHFAKGGFSVGAQLRVIAEALVGLHYAHELCGPDGNPLNIVHRDFSPLNVFVTVEGQVKVIDFGIAKSVDSSVYTSTGVLKGRLAYMAPEQAWGGELDRRADIYAAGVMVWEAVAGRRLWPGMSDMEIITRLSREGPPHLSSVCPDAPEKLRAICERAMSWDLEKRYATAADLAADLIAHLVSRDDAMTLDEIGALVRREFGAELRHVHAAIAESLAQISSGGRPARIPPFDFIASSGSTTRLVHEDLSRYWVPVWPRLDRQTKRGSPPRWGTPPSTKSDAPSVLPAHANAASLVPTVAAFSWPDGVRAPDRASAVGVVVPSVPVPIAAVTAPRPSRIPTPFPPTSLTTETTTGKKPTSKRRPPGTLALSVGGAMFVVALLATLVRDGFGRGSPRSAPVPSAIAAAPTPEKDTLIARGAAASREFIELIIRVTPMSAQVVVDGAAVSGNPSFGRYVRDGQVHHVLAFADGFEPKWADVSFGADSAIDLTLDRRASVLEQEREPATTVKAVPAPPALRRPRPAPELWREFPSGS